MSTKQSHCCDFKGQTQDDEYLNALISHMPKLNALFEILGSGETPDFFQMWEALSEMVAFYTEGDSNGKLSHIEKILMSQKKCRFCS